ncbi:glycosyltransferase family 2 protein [Aeromonas veronii]
MNISLSIVMPTYGRPTGALAFLQNIAPKLDDFVEVVIVDDNGLGSANQIETKKVLTPHLKNNIKYLALEKNLGAGSARNYGVDNSQGQYIAFMDDDDELIYDALIRKLNHALELKCQVLCSDMFIKQNGKIIDSKSCYFKSSDPKEFLLCGNTYTPMIMVSKDAFNQIGGFEPISYYQDHVLMLKIFVHKIAVDYFKEKTFIHNAHNGPRISGIRKSSDGFSARLYYEAKLLDVISLNKNWSNIYCFNLNRMELFIRNIDNDVKTFWFIKYLFRQLILIRSVVQFIRLFKDLFTTLSR